jgi:mRNA capping enzyme
MNKTTPQMANDNTTDSMDSSIDKKFTGGHSPNANTKTTKQDLEQLLSAYLASNPVRRSDRKVNEVEIRFNTNSRKYRPLSKIDYDNVVKFLYAFGFKTDLPEGFYSLRIFHEYMDSRGRMTMSNIRAEIVGLDLIQEYCRTNSIQHLLNMSSSTYDKIKFTQKSLPEHEGQRIKPVVFEDFNLKISYQLEQNSTARSDFIRGILEKWGEKYKTFRYLNRVRFYHPDLPVFADISIVRSSKMRGNEPIKTYDIQDSGVLNGVESYEIEMEIDNDRVGTGTAYNNAKSLVELIRKMIRIILSGLQGTNYPISYIVSDNILFQYMQLIKGNEYQRGRILPRDFIGPSSTTLQMENIIPLDDNSNIPNIRKHYTVTDKADGERRLLFINPEGHMYMIDTNMSVIFTGAKVQDKALFESLLDGEFIKYDKAGKVVNLYAAFDVYFIHKKSTREFMFAPTGEEIEPISDVVEETPMSVKEKRENKAAEEKKPVRYRLALLQQFIQRMKPVSTSTGESKKDSESICDFHIKTKNFCMTTPNVTIFQACSKILSDINDGIYPYNTDGLIFTPSNTAVASNVLNSPVAGPLQKITWERSFKWKPPEFNTIDFLVSIKKDKTGKDAVYHIFQDGKNVEGLQNFVQYKTLILRCGYDEKKHGYLQPFQDMIENKLPNPEDIDNESGYKPVKFIPTNPYDENACYANILLREDKNRNFSLYTVDGEYFEEHMIVEFRYDMTKSDGWKWVPIRVRYDKTTELRNGLNNFGNAYHVANNNWQSIHRPITSEMISEDKGIPEFLEVCGEENSGTNEIGSSVASAGYGVYYNRIGNEKTTRSLRDFHNLFVKRKLIASVASRKDNLIDYAVGKAGDISKWINSNLGFVFGIDISWDNIHNRYDGACARYLNYRKRNRQMPGALFVNGDSGKLIRAGSGDAFTTQKDKEIASAIFGKGPKDAKLLGEGVYRYYGIAEQGFQISSCQFALHYFWETPQNLFRFLRNIADCTAVNGYFIGTCFDGATVFKLLQNKNEGESVSIFEGDRKIFELTKKYSHTGYSPDETSLGYAIDVYQETINKTFREYLVNFDYFVKIMSDFGFVLITNETAHKIGLPSGSGLFDELFSSMQSEIKRNPKAANDYGTAQSMTVDEKRISFLNRYFVFRKANRVDSEKVAKFLLKHEAELPTLNELEEKLFSESVEKESRKLVVGKPKGKRVKIVAKEPKPEIVEPEPVKEETKETKEPTKMKIKVKAPKK